jgi:hypothetical protein
MDIDKIRAQLSRIDREKRALEQKIQVLQGKKLVALPKQLGLDSVDSLIVALARYASPAMRTYLQSMRPDGAGDLEAPGRARRERFSPELRGRIKTELEQGKKSVAQLSREYGPSHPTIMGWKREWGMTHPRPRRAQGNGNAR